MKKMWLTFSLLLSCCYHQAHAEDIIITAEDRVEVYQEEKKAVAIGDAVAQKDGITVKAQRLTAYFSQKQTESSKNENSISKLLAEKKANLDMDKAHALGDSMEYNLEEDYILIKGKPAVIKNDKAKVSATESITYFPTTNQAVAKGNVVADNGKNKIYSDEMEAYFKKDQKGELVLERIEIPQNPKIVTKDGDVKAKKGIYYPDQGMVYMYDDVVINQNGNILKGDKAETNLNSGISRILSGKSQVSGVWHEED